MNAFASEVAIMRYDCLACSGLVVLVVSDVFCRADTCATQMWSCCWERWSIRARCALSPSICRGIACAWCWTIQTSRFRGISCCAWRWTQPRSEKLAPLANASTNCCLFIGNELLAHLHANHHSPRPEEWKPARGCQLYSQGVIFISLTKGGSLFHIGPGD